MRHLKKGRKLGSSAAHRKAMLRSLATALFTNERIKTTEPKAKESRMCVGENLLKGKRGDVHSRRLAMAELGDKELVDRLFSDIAPRFEEREGGYTRILKLGPRKGDGAPMVIWELVE